MIDAPVATILLSYHWLDRLDLRVFLAAVTALDDVHNPIHV